MRTVAALTIAVSLVMFGLLRAQTSTTAGLQAVKDSSRAAISVEKQKQLILWTSGDREAALKMVFMYAFYCKQNSWMDTVRLLIWGPSARLLAEDQELQGRLKELKKVGVELYGCKACADQYGVSDKLKDLGVNVLYAGKMLAELQKAGWHVLTI